MRIGQINGNVVFKSGYPTFGSAGHLSCYVPDKYDLVYYHSEKPKETKVEKKLNYLA